MKTHKKRDKPRGKGVGTKRQGALVTAHGAPALEPSATKVPEKAQSPQPHRWTVLLSSIPILISSLALVVSLVQCTQVRKTFRAHVRPDVQCVVRRSSLAEQKDRPFAAELVIWNGGPIKAVSVYASYRLFIVNPETLDVPASMGISEDLIDHSILQTELAVGQKIGKTILSTDPMAVYVVNTVFYRENDMEKFTREDFFLYDSGTFLGYEEFKARNDFAIIMKNLQSKMRAEAIGPTTASSHMSPASQGASKVTFNFGTLAKDGSWTNSVGTNPVSITPLPRDGATN